MPKIPEEKPQKQEFSSVKFLFKADREKKIEQYGKQVSMRPSKVNKSKKDYDLISEHLMFELC